LGADDLWGDRGDDVFVFEPGDSEEDRLLDFNDQGIDTIDLTAFATDFNSLQISQDGDDAVVDIPDFQRIRLVDFLFSDLKEDDFRF
jgi:Ca2+-binding RTX toxin-like protein